jgi:hypothetical protein
MERRTYLSSIEKNDAEKYMDLKSPQNDIESGALVKGGAIELFSREAFGLFTQYGAIGVIYGMIPNLNYAIFNNYLQMEGYQTASYGILVSMGWSFKVFFGVLSDCFPIFGYRRKSWILIGWSVTLVCLSVMTFTPLGDPYCDARKTDLCSTPLANISKADQDAYFNFEAPRRGSLFIILSSLVSFGYVTVACASDALVVQYAHREPEAIRGRIQTAIYVVRTMTGVLSQLVIAFCLNGREYGGSFDFSIGPNTVYAICLVPCVLVVFATIFIVVEPKRKEDVTPGQWCSHFWDLLQKRVMWQICAFRFINNMFLHIRATPALPIEYFWAKVEPVNCALSGVIGNMFFAGVLCALGKWGLNWNWRWTISIATFGYMGLSAILMSLTIWDILRNQWFYTGMNLAHNIPSGVLFIVASYCAVEIADVGNEGATYGLVTTVYNLAKPFAAVIYKFVNSYFKVTQKDILSDTTEVRWHVTYVYLFAYICQLFSLLFLFLIPPQKAQMQELKKLGGKSKLAGVIFVTVFVLCLLFALTTNIMSIFPSTRCHRIAGGDGQYDADGKCPEPTK